MAGRPKGATTGGRTCGRCRQKWQRLPGEAGEAFCPSCRTTDRRRTHGARNADKHGQAQPAQRADTADYPGAEWAPLPPALLIKISAHVLAREYVAWAANRKASHVDNSA